MRAFLFCCKTVNRVRNVPPVMTCGDLWPMLGPLCKGAPGEINMTHCMLVLCTCPNQSTANAIATALVEERLAACVSQLPGIRSLYRWEDHVEKDEEVLLLIKTTTSCYERLEPAVQRLHPYELPEIIGVRIDDGAQNYLDWIRKSTL
jgi:periplasmic divalent cation tolerance protein